MTQLVRMCKYGCDSQLGQFDINHNKYLQTNGTLHTRERCESLKQKLGNGTDLSVEVQLEKLAPIGNNVRLEQIEQSEVNK
jgi:hypothetical protein